MSEKKKTTKTEFARYLNTYGADVAAVSDYFPVYDEAPNRGGTFGFWLRTKHIAAFNKAYKDWWLKKDELWGVIYEDNEDTYEPYK